MSSRYYLFVYTTHTVAWYIINHGLYCVPGSFYIKKVIKSNFPLIGVSHHHCLPD